MYTFTAIKQEHASLIHEWKSDSYMIKMALDESTLSTLSSQQQDIKNANNRTSSQYHLIAWNDEHIGYIRVDWMDDKHTCAWLRFALGKHRNQGHMSKALQQYIANLFKQGCHRIEAEVYEYNKPSIHVLTRLGFVQEGIKRHAHVYQDTYYNVLVFGLLQSDFRNNKVNVQTKDQT